MRRRRILPRTGQVGGCVLRLSPSERALLSNLPQQLGEVLGALGPAMEEAAGSELPPSLKRLFPPAYTRDDDAERNYAAGSRQELLSHHRQALQTLSETARAKALDAGQVQEWMTAINDIRLVLGTVLEVSEDMQPPRGSVPQQLAYYYFLSSLQEELVDYLSGFLPDPVPGADDLVPEDPWGEPLGGLRWDGTPQPPPPPGEGP